MNVQEASKLLAFLTAAMPNTQKQDLGFTAEVWAEVLPDVSYSLGKMAIIKLLRERKISVIPTPGEVLETSKNILGSVQKNTPPDVYSAWDEVNKKLGYVSKSGIQWSHPAIKKTVQLIGAYTIATATYDIFPRFEKTYMAVLNRKEDDYENKVSYQIAQSIDMNNLIADTPESIANERMLNGKDAIKFIEGEKTYA